jgi:hypothetical protein
VYAPALVAFVGGPNFRLSLAVGGSNVGVAWFPLGPGEVYRPAYRVSREYFTNVNISNTQINTTYVTNVYNNPTSVAQITYVNRQVPSAVTAVRQRCSRSRNRYRAPPPWRGRRWRRRRSPKPQLAEPRERDRRGTPCGEQTVGSRADASGGGEGRATAAAGVVA